MYRTMCLVLGLCLVNAAQGLFAAESLKLDVAEMPANLRRLIDGVAPNIKWKEASYNRADNNSEDPRWRASPLYVIGQDAKERKVVVTLSRGARPKVTTWVTAADLPMAVAEAMKQKEDLGKWKQIRAIGATVATSDEYTFDYENGGELTISADGKSVQALGFRK